MKKTWCLLAVAVSVEMALLALAHWQWQRYGQRMAEQAAVAARASAELTGHYLPTVAALTQQPNPSSPEESGWRILGLLQTSQSLVVIDRGYATPQFATQGTPEFTRLAPPAGQQTLRGFWAPFPVRKGWLGGPDTTTHPKLLAFLNPARLTSATVAPQQFVLSAANPSSTLLQPSAPPTANPLRHLSYMLQWLVMALIFPLLCWALWRRR